MTARTDLMIVGAQKAATTTLFDMLAGSEGVVGARPKEPHFFSTEDRWRARLDSYHRIYGGRDGAIRCEASTSYTFFPHRRLEIWNDIHEYNPATRIVYVVRRPAARILSQYRHSVRRGYRRGDLRHFVLRNPLALAISRYHTQIDPFVQTFGRDNVLLLDFDDLVTRREGTLAAIAGFVGIDPTAMQAAPALHSNRSETVSHHRLRGLAGLGRRIDGLAGRRRAALADAASMPTDLERAIERELELEIAALERLMDRDLSHWRRG